MPDRTSAAEQFRVSNLLKLSKQATALHRPDLAARALDAAAASLLPPPQPDRPDRPEPGQPISWQRTWPSNLDVASTATHAAEVHPDGRYRVLSFATGEVTEAATAPDKAAALNRAASALRYFTANTPTPKDAR